MGNERPFERYILWYTPILWYSSSVNVGQVSGSVHRSKSEFLFPIDVIRGDFRHVFRDRKTPQMFRGHRLSESKRAA